MSDPRDWRRLYAAAILEVNWTQVPLRVERAEQAIQARLGQLPETLPVNLEQAELQWAFQNLRSGKAVRVTSRLTFD